MRRRLRVLIVDDHQMFREGIRGRLERESDIEVTGEAGSAEQALEFLEKSQPDIVLTDIRLPGASGIELARTVRRKWPNLKLLVLTGYDFDQYVKAMVRIGVNGYLLKDSPQDSLVEALRAVAAGGAVLPPKIASKVIRSYSEAEPGESGHTLEPLTVREIEVLELMQQGLRNLDIGERLAISPRTVETHVGSIMSKLGAQNRTDSIRIAFEKNLIK